MNEQDLIERRIAARVAIIAAVIWDQGYSAGYSDSFTVCHCGAWNDGECACGNYGNGERPEPNPYRHDD